MHDLHGEIEGRARDALGLRVRPQRGLECGKGLLLRVCRSARQSAKTMARAAKNAECIGRSKRSRSVAPYISETRPPPWRSSRPAISSSSRPCARSPAMSATAAPDRRSNWRSARAGRRPPARLARELRRGAVEALHRAAIGFAAAEDRVRSAAMTSLAGHHNRALLEQLLVPSNADRAQGRSARHSRPCGARRSRSRFAPLPTMPAIAASR